MQFIRFRTGGRIPLWLKACENTQSGWAWTRNHGEANGYVMTKGEAEVAAFMDLGHDQFTVEGVYGIKPQPKSLRGPA